MKNNQMQSLAKKNYLLFFLDIEVYDSIVIHKHSFGIPVTVRAATCCEEGRRSYTCSYCGLMKEEKIANDPNNHTGGTEIRDDILPTYGADGCTGDTYCLGCGAKIADGESIPALVIYGDIDGSGEVTAADACLALRASVKLETLTEL